MASYTTNLNLKKPAGSENVAIGDINNNMDTIDQAYGTLNSNFRVNSLTNTQGIQSVAIDETLCPNYTVRWFNLRNSLTSELPNSDAAYGIAEVRARSSGARTVTIYAENNNIYFASYNGSWSNWRKVSNEAV